MAHVVQFWFCATWIEPQEEDVVRFQKFIEKLHVRQRTITHEHQALDGKQQAHACHVAWHRSQRL